MTGQKCESCGYLYISDLFIRKRCPICREILPKPIEIIDWDELLTKTEENGKE